MLTDRALHALLTPVLVCCCLRGEDGVEACGAEVRINRLLRTIIAM